MSRNYFKSGDWNVICDRCGFKKKASEVRKTWDGFYVCDEDWETRHIADFIKAPKPIQPLPWTRPEGVDVYVGPTYTTDDEGVVTLPVIILGGGAVTVTLPDATMPGDPTAPTPQVPSPTPIPTPRTLVPSGPVIVPVVIPVGVVPTTITLPCTWPTGTIFKLRNNNPDILPTISNPCDYTIIREGNWRIYYVYLNSTTETDLATEINNQHSGADVYNTANTYIVTCTEQINGLTIESFPVGTVIQLINKGVIVGAGGNGGSGNAGEAGGLGQPGGAAIDIDCVITIAIDNSNGYIFGGGGGGGRSGYVSAESFPADQADNSGKVVASYAAGGGGPGYSSNAGATNTTLPYIKVTWTEGAAPFPNTVTLSNTLGTIVPTSSTWETPTPLPTMTCTQVMTAATGGSISGISPVSGTGGAAFIATGDATGTSGAGGNGASDFGEAGITGGTASGTGEDEDFLTIGDPKAGGAGGYAIQYITGTSVTIDDNGNNATQIKGTVGIP